VYRTYCTMQHPCAKNIFSESVCQTSSQASRTPFGNCKPFNFFAPTHHTRCYSARPTWKEWKLGLTADACSGGAFCKEVAFFLLAMHKRPCVCVRSWLVEPASLLYVANDAVLTECITSPCFYFDYLCLTNRSRLVSVLIGITRVCPFLLTNHAPPRVARKASPDDC